MGRRARWGWCRRRRVAGGAALLGALVAGSIGAADPTELHAQRADAVEVEVAGRRAMVQVERHHEFPAINSAELASFWTEGARSGRFLRARLGGTALSFEVGSPFFRYGDRAFQMANAPYDWGGSFWIPAEFVTEWLPPRGAQIAGRAADAVPVDGPLPGRVDPAVPWRVVIDPGHGGHDPGALGDRTREKDVVLAISRIVHEALRDVPLIEPYMTRDDDTYVEHDLRSRFAVDRAGDLFVSIHANSTADGRALGFETIFLGPARSEEARSVALRENRGPSVGGDVIGPSDELQFILTGMDRTENLTESRRFAGFVQNAIRDVRRGRSPDRGVKQGPWWVLLGALARMPSVIVEVGFLSHDGEEAYLASPEGQRQLGEAIADAVVEYRDDVLRRYAADAPERRR